MIYDNHFTSLRLLFFRLTMQENSIIRILRRINNVRMSEIDAAGSSYLPLLCGRSRVGTVPLEAVDQMKLFPHVFKGTF